MVAEGAANNLQVFILIFTFIIDSKLLLLSLGMLFIDRGFSPVQKVICSTITLRHYKEKLKKHQLTNYWETKVFIVLLYYPYLV